MKMTQEQFEVAAREIRSGLMIEHDSIHEAEQRHLINAFQNLYQRHVGGTSDEGMIELAKEIRMVQLIEEFGEE